MGQANRHVIAALATLIILQGIMLSALYAGIRPHPPVATPLFGIAPFLGAAMSVALASIIVHPLDGWVGRTLTVLAALMALVSLGPQKYFDAQFGLIYPAVLLGQFASLVVFVTVVKTARSHQEAVVELA